MWAMAKATICMMKLPSDPNRSPSAENNMARVICHGVSHMDAMVSIVSGNAIRHAGPGSEKYIAAAATNAPVEKSTMAFTFSDFNFRIAIMSNFLLR